MPITVNPDIHLIESHDDMRRWLTGIMKAVGWRVSAGSGWEPLEDDTITPRWLLIDADNAPGNWIPSLTAFRKKHSSTRILLTASHTDPARLLAWLRSGIGRILAKPFTRGELFSALGLEDRYSSETGDTILHWLSDDSRIRRGVKDWIELETASAPGLEAWLARWLELYLSHRVPEMLLRDIRIGVGEMLANAIEWGNRDLDNGKIYLSCALFPTKVLIRIRDDGPGFDYTGVPDPTHNPFEAMDTRKRQGKRVGGYGLFLAKKVTSELIYNHKGNEAILVWRMNDFIKRDEK